MSFYISELNKLQNVQRQLERAQINTIEQLGKCNDAEYDSTVELLRRSRISPEEADSKLEIGEVFEKLNLVRRAVVLEGGVNISDLKAFQDELVGIIDTIQVMKDTSTMRIQDLQIEEDRLFEDVRLYNERMIYWTEPPKLDFLKNEVHARIDSSNSVPKDVKKFMDFVKISSGHENGWTVSDHHLFLKLRKKYKAIEELALNINEMLPDISIAEVKKHEVWYLKYLSLKEKHNESIRRWQKLKEDMKNTNVGVVDQFVNSQEMKANPFVYIEKVEIKTIERKKIRDEITRWKREKELLNNLEKSLREEKTKEMLLRHEKSQEKFKQKREMVKRWKLNKQILEEEQKYSTLTKSRIEQNLRASVANKMIRLYQAQDQISINRRKQHHIKCEEPGEEKRTRDNSQVSRDPKRLFRPTRQWINRFLSINEKNTNDTVNFITRVPKLQRPPWRNNL